MGFSFGLTRSSNARWSKLQLWESSLSCRGDSEDGEKDRSIPVICGSGHQHPHSFHGGVKKQPTCYTKGHAVASILIVVLQLPAKELDSMRFQAIPM